MRANEPMKSYANIKVEGVAVPQWLADYINQLRYDRMMTKAKYFRDIAKIVYSDDDEYVFSSNTLFKNSMRDIETTCMRISYAYEERAKRIKEGK